MKKAIENIDLPLLKNSITNGSNVKGMNISELVKKRANIEFLKVLLENGADVDSRDTDYGTSFSSLMIASKHGYTEIVKLLIDNGADLNFKETMG